ncbi:hypothetical protein [Achromobacter sp. GbtcB20]|uniref:hypothetical protein n=1 Tax=Achromobacter sp. GbtcB20 TaxID=2824765 RepID=UPI001266AECD|nr:hypothetical protein [Achromobacter sp. GbtcB20]
MSLNCRSKLAWESDAEHRAIVARAEQLWGTREVLLDAALAAVGRLHESALAGDQLGIEHALQTYEAVVWKLNGGSFFGSRDCCNPDAGGNVVDRYCAASPGQDPLWGQNGEFLICVLGVRARVEIMEGFGRAAVRMHFHVVDLHRPFVSETGFLSVFDKVRMRMSPRKLAEETFQSRLGKRPPYLESNALLRLAGRESPAWLATALFDSGAPAAHDEAGQFALSF